LLSSGAINRATVHFNAERAAKERLEARRREEAKTAGEAAAQAGQMMAGEAGAMEAVKTPNPQLPQPETPMATNLIAEAKTLLRDHLRVEDRVLTADVFPGSDGVMAMDGLVG
jgi:hypothetical protein